MSNLFSPDSRFMQAMSRVCDLLVLNILFLLCCIPVITIGPASTALYTVCFRFDTDREQGAVKCFLSAFRSNFRQGVGLWLILLICAGSALANIYLFQLLSGPARYCGLLFGPLFILALLTGSYAFPLLSRFQNSTLSTLKNAFALSIGFFPRSVLICTINCLPFLLIFFDLYLFLQTGFIWVAIYFSAAVYINSLLLKPVFARYESPDTTA